MEGRHRAEAHHSSLLSWLPTQFFTSGEQRHPSDRPRMWGGFALSGVEFLVCSSVPSVPALKSPT